MTLNLSKKKYLSNYIEFNQRNSLAKLCMYILTYVLYGQESEIWCKIEKKPIEFEQINKKWPQISTQWLTMLIILQIILIQVKLGKT